MLILRNNVPVGWLDTAGKQLLSFPKVLASSSVTSHVLQVEGLQLNVTQDSESEIGMRLEVGNPDNYISISAINSLEDFSTSNIKALAVAVKLSKLVGEEKEWFIGHVTELLEAYDIMTGELAPKERLDSSIGNIRLKAFITKVNERYFPVVTSKKTTAMESPDSEIILALPTPREVFNNSDISPFPLPNLNDLFQIPKEMKSYFYKEYIQRQGIPEGDVVGYKNNDNIELRPNEERLFSELKHIWLEVTKLTYRIEPSAPEFDLKRPKQFIELMDKLIYLALHANWYHTVCIKTIADLSTGDSDNDDDDDSDSGGNTQDNDELAGDFFYNYTSRELEAKLQAIRAAFRDQSIGAVLDGHYRVMRFIANVDGKQPSIDNYIIAFIKLLRWGSAKISRLILPTFPKIFLDLDLFIEGVNVDSLEREPYFIEGRQFLVTNCVFSTTCPSPTTMMQVGMTDKIRGAVLGLTAEKLFVAKGTNQESYINDKYFLDIFNIYERYKNGKESEKLFGIEFENDEFYYSEDEVMKVCKGERSELSGVAVINDIHFSITQPDLNFDIADMLLDEFLTADIPDKKSKLNLVYFTKLLELPNVSAAPDIFQLWFMRTAKLFACAKNISDSEYIDVCTFLNALHSNYDEIMSTSLEKSATQSMSVKLDKSTAISGEAPEEQLAKGDVDLSKIIYTDVFVNRPLSVGIPVNAPNGALFAYFDPASKSLVSRYSTCITVQNEEAANYALTKMLTSAMRSILTGATEQKQVADVYYKWTHLMVEFLRDNTN